MSILIFSIQFMVYFFISISAMSQSLLTVKDMSISEMREIRQHLQIQLGQINQQIKQKETYDSFRNSINQYPESWEWLKQLPFVENGTITL